MLITGYPASVNTILRGRTLNEWNFAVEKRDQCWRLTSSKLASGNVKTGILYHSPAVVSCLVCTTKCRTNSPKSFLFVFLTFLPSCAGFSMQCSSLKSCLFWIFFSSGGGVVVVVVMVMVECSSPPACFCFPIAGAPDHVNCDKSPF